ncbi:MAG: Ig-like domain-containing protein [Ruminococcus sp.]|nr:Ig-like domain-containing protein [Ruminococcus sp.]
MKKLTAIFIAVLLVIGCFSVMAVSAADTATITVDGKTYTVDVGKTLTYTVNLKTVHKITNGEFYLGYPQDVLSIDNDEAFDFPVVGKSSVTYNYNENIQNEFRFNFSNQANPIDFTNDGVLVTIGFTVKAAGSGSIGFINDTQAESGQLTRETILSWVDTDYSINDELPNATFTYTVTGYNTDQPTTESQTPTESQVTTPTETQVTTPTETQATQPTEAPATAIKVTAAKTSIYVKGTTKVTATVTNPVGATTFKSSNTGVATVKASGNVATVTAKKAGSVTITATNNGKNASVKITISKKANTMTVKAKACSAKASKKTTIKKAKAFTIKNAKGTVTFKKVSGDKKITINKKTGNITVKKGLKKGKTYKLKVSVTAAGNTEYKAATKKVTVKIKITK